MPIARSTKGHLVAHARPDSLAYSKGLGYVVLIRLCLLDHLVSGLIQLPVDRHQA
jgi:hypothetical protein